MEATTFRIIFYLELWDFFSQRRKYLNYTDTDFQIFTDAYTTDKINYQCLCRTDTDTLDTVF